MNKQEEADWEVYKGICSYGSDTPSNVSSLPLDTPVNVAMPDVPLRESPPIKAYVPPESTWEKVKRLCKEYW